MGKGRLEAFSDGVIAILITIMVLEIKVPRGDTPSAVEPLLPVLLSYVLSFVYIGIYWNNHHHMLHVTRLVDGRVLWGNLHLLFWLSLVPIATTWLGENSTSPWPTAAYGGVLFMAAVAFSLLKVAIIIANGPDSLLAIAVGSDRKGKISIVVYVLAMMLAFVRPWIAEILYVLAALMWLVPDPRIEKIVASKGE